MARHWGESGWLLHLNLPPRLEAAPGCLTPRSCSRNAPRALTPSPIPRDRENTVRSRPGAPAWRIDVISPHAAHLKPRRGNPDRVRGCGDVKWRPIRDWRCASGPRMGGRLTSNEQLGTAANSVNRAEGTQTQDESAAVGGREVR